MFTNSKIMYFLRKIIYYWIWNSYLWVWKFWKFIFTKNDFISFLLRNFHWIVWPFYTNFSHKTNNRKGNIILSFKTLGIKLCRRVVVCHKKALLENCQSIPWLQGWKCRLYKKNLVWEIFVTSKANSLCQCLAAFWYLPRINKTEFTRGRSQLISDWPDSTMYVAYWSGQIDPFAQRRIGRQLDLIFFKDIFKWHYNGISCIKNIWVTPLSRENIKENINIDDYRMWITVREAFIKKKKKI